MKAKASFRPMHRAGTLLLMSLILIFQTSATFGQGTAFTYQGRLAQSGSPHSGPVEMQFTLFDAPTGSVAIATNSPPVAAIDVSNGLFTAVLDFGGGAFNGGARWLEVAVRTNGAGAFTKLAPRQQISAAPYALTARDVTGGVAAEQLVGTIRTANIGEGTIHSNHLAVGSVHSNALVIGSIHSNHLAVGSIHSNALALGSVTAAALANGAIHSNHLAAGSVHSNALVIGSIHSNHLAVGSVHSNALALGSVTTRALADAIIHSNHLAVGSVHSNILAIGSIHSNHLSAGSVHSNILALGSVTAAALANGAIHSNHLAVGSVHSNALVIGSIHSNHLAVGSVHSNALALGSVTTRALADAIIHSNHLAVGSVHSNALVIGSIHSNHLAARSIHSNALALGSITAAALADGAIHSNHLAVGSVHSNALVIGSIHSNHLAVGSVHSNALALGSVTTRALADAIIHSNHLAAGSVHSNALVIGSIHSNHLAAGSIHSNALALGSVTATALALGSIHSNHLAVGSIHSNALALGSVTAIALANDSIHSNHLAVGAISPDNLIASLSGSFSTSVTNPSVGFFEYFGVAVAAVGTDKVLVGAYQDSTGWDNAGAAYLMNTSGTLLTTFLSPAPQNQENFGFAVASLGQDKVLIGADGNSVGGQNSGAAYLFNIDGTLITTFTNPTPAASDFFGYSVAVVGSDKVLVGAYGDHFGANLGGAAYLFSTNRTLLTTFTNPTPAGGDRFGIAVAAVGADKVLVGADRDDGGTLRAGVAYLFHINGALLATFLNPTPTFGDAFGAAVTAVGLDKVLIGATADNSNGNDGGAAYLFNTSGTLLATLTNPTPTSGDQFGIAVSAVDANHVLIGAAFDDNGVGAAYLFTTGGTLLWTFHNPAPANGDLFGNAVAAVGTGKILVGAPQDDAGATDSGATYLFALESYTPGLLADTVRPGSITTSRLEDGAVTIEKLDSTIGVWTRAGSDVYRTTGNVGIGTSAPQEPLHVMGNNSHLRLQDSVLGNYWSIYAENHPVGADGNLLFVPGPSGAFGFIQKSTGNYFSSSDARLKKDITNLGGVLDRVLRLRPVSYRFSSAPESASPTIGLIAQEVEPLFPGAVAEHDDMKALAYSALVPVTVGAIQELNQKLERKLQQKETEIAELKARLDKLERQIDQKARRTTD